MDDDDAVEASAPIPRKGGASAGKGHYLDEGVDDSFAGIASHTIALT